MSALWTREALVAATKGEARGDWDAAQGVSIDTRTIRPGDLFAALTDRRDGHDFVRAAIEAGAAVAMVSRVPEGCEEAPLLVVDDTLFALESLGQAARGRAGELSAVAVTGSVGKTSVKEALRTALSPQGRTHASEKSYNNHWGVPLTLARMPQETRFGVFEIGMNRAGEITPLTRLVSPHVAIVTTIAPAHLGNFDSEEGIADAKAEIFGGLVPGGAALVNDDNPFAERLADAARDVGARVIRFGSEAGEARIVSLARRADGSSIEADVLGERVLYRLNAPGRHHALNSLAVLTASVLAGADLAKSALALKDWRPGGGRGARERIRLDPIDPASAFELIDESYNANPASLRAALETLGLAEPGKDATGRTGRRIAIFGDMLEMGERADELHAAIADLPEMAAVDAVYTCGKHSRALHEALPSEKRGAWAEDSAALAPVVVAAIRAGDVAVVKGSLGSRMAVVVDHLKTPQARRKRA